MESRTFAELRSTSYASVSTVSSGMSTPLSDSGVFSGVCTPATERSVLFEDLPISSPISEPADDEYILVVGGLGFIGSHTSWELLKAGKNVIIVDNCSNSYQNVFDKLQHLRQTYLKPGSRPALDFHQADYRDKDSLREILQKYSTFMIPKSDGSDHVGPSKISGVIHFAAYKAVAESFRKPLDYYANNVGGMIDFCATLGEFGIKTFIFSSSATVYGELANKGGRLTEEQCDNSGCTGLTNPYGRTKWMCEAILNDLAVSDPEWTIVALRYFNPIGCDESGVLGEDPRDTPNNLMPVVIKAMTGDLPALNVFGTDWDTPDGTAIRDFIHVSDLAQGHVAALRASKKADFERGYHTYNLGTGTGHSVTEIITAMQNVSGRTIPINPTGRREGDVGMCIAEPTKSARTLDWKTQKTLTKACWDICRYLGLGVKSDEAASAVDSSQAPISA